MTSIVLVFCFIVQLSDLNIINIKARRTADWAALAGAVGSSPIISSGTASQSAVAAALGSHPHR